MPKLLMTAAGKTRQVHLQPNENTLGRGAQNEVVLNSTFASRQHAVIAVGSAFTTIRDLQSLNQGLQVPMTILGGLASISLSVTPCISTSCSCSQSAGSGCQRHFDADIISGELAARPLRDRRIQCAAQRVIPRRAA